MRRLEPSVALALERDQQRRQAVELKYRVLVRADVLAGGDPAPAPRGMKMAFEGSVRSGPNVWFIRDRGLHWENADG